MISSMGQGSAAALRQDAAKLRQQIEAGHTLNIGDSVVLLDKQPSLLDARAGKDSLHAVEAENGQVVVTDSQTVRRDNTAWQVAAGLVGGLLGMLLAGSSNRAKGVAAGLALGGLAAWGTGQALADSHEEVRRVTADGQGVRSEFADESSYFSNWARTGPAPEPDPKAAKEFIDSVKI